MWRGQKYKESPKEVKNEHIGNETVLQCDANSTILAKLLSSMKTIILQTNSSICDVHN